MCVSHTNASPQTTRGTGADVILIDEMAHIPDELFFQVIAPILSMANTALMGLSSPLGEDNYMSALMGVKLDNGEDFFVTLNCFRICKSCKKLERSKAIKCTHVPNTPHWLSAGKIKELKMLYKARPEDAMREFGGLIISNNKPALCKDEVKACISGERVVVTGCPPYIFTACDPNGGGPSQMSLASGYFDDFGNLVVCHLGAGHGALLLTTTRSLWRLTRSPLPMIGRSVFSSTDTTTG